MYTVFSSNCESWNAILSIVSDWQFISTGEKQTLFPQARITKENRKQYYKCCIAESPLCTTDTIGVI